MNPANRYRLPALRSALAAEYALGTLTGRARRRFTRLMVMDPALRDEVRLWKLRLAALAFSRPAPGSTGNDEPRD